MDEPPPQPTPKQNWQLLLEVSALAGAIIPLGNVIAPIVFWGLKKEEITEVRNHGPEVVNFNASWTIWSILTCGLGAIPYLIFLILRIVKAASGQSYRAPLTLDLLK